MSLQIDLITANALAKLRLQEFQPVLAHIRAVRDDALERMAVAGDPNQWLRAQGRAQVAKELLDAVQGIEQIVTKLTSAPR
jgi:hypothetical protein